MITKAEMQAAACLLGGVGNAEFREITRLAMNYLDPAEGEVIEAAITLYLYQRQRDAEGENPFK